MADPASWEAYWDQVSNSAGQDYSLTGSAIPGSGALTPAHHQNLHLTVVLCLTLANIFSRLVKDCLSPAFASLSDRARALALSALQLDDAELCFRALPKIGHLTSAQYSAVLGNREDLRRCRISRQWGPKDEPMRHLCCPAFLMFLVWVGAPIADPILDFVFAYALSNTSFVEPWLDCPTPYVHHISFKAIQDRLEALRNNDVHRTPANKLACLAEAASATSKVLLRTLYMAAGECVNIPATELFVDNIAKPLFAGIIATAAPQLPATTTALPTGQVISELPICSSLPGYSPNFTPDHNPQWFRSATYHFSSLRFPTDVVARGDASAERAWHEYACNVLRARVICMQLSEQQVISHISQDFQRSDPHFAISEDCRVQTGCTVLFWLSALREFFFTNKQFRHNIELAWQQYRVGHARDFNELIHHVRVYYQLIFLDYPTLPGKMTLHDFAWHLFEKMQHFLSGACRTELARTAQLCVPLSGVLEQMQLHLQDRIMVSTALEADPAHVFVTWCLKQLKLARETANKTRQYATIPDTRTTIDYAHLTGRQAPSAPASTGPTSNNNTDRGRRGRPTALINSGRPTNSSVQTPSATTSSDTDPLTRRNLPADIRESIGRKGRPLTETQLREIARRLVPWMSTLLLHELDHPGAGDTLHGLARAYSDARKPSYRLATTPLAFCQYLLKSHLIYTRPLCSICPHGDGTTDRRHTVADCPEARQHCPGPLATFLANPVNTGKSFMAVEPGQPIPADTVRPRRDRCDPRPAASPAPAATHATPAAQATKRQRPANIR